MIQLPSKSVKHGTLAEYKRGCRCVACRAANAAYTNRRRALASTQARHAKVIPNGPPIASTRANGRKVWRCPGTEGAPCVKGGRELLNGALVCLSCAKKATTWDGLVPADRARAHLLALSAAGIGRRNVAAACSVSPSLIKKIMRGERTQVRKSTEAQILSVDSGALADYSTVPRGPVMERIASLRRLGFSAAEIARVLGSRDRHLRIGQRTRIQLRKAAAVEKLMKRVEKGEVTPRSWGDPKDIKELIRRGVQVPLGMGAEHRAHFLMELEELRRSRTELKPQNRSEVNAEATINLAHFQE